MVLEKHWKESKQDSYKSFCGQWDTYVHGSWSQMECHGLKSLGYNIYVILWWVVNKNKGTESLKSLKQRTLQYGWQYVSGKIFRIKDEMLIYPNVGDNTEKLIIIPNFGNNNMVLFLKSIPFISITMQMY